MSPPGNRTHPPDPTGPDVSIVIPNWNGGDVLVECVTSILAHTTGVDFELILVDNGSTDASREAVASFAERDPRVTAILNDDNLMFARACNQGWAASRGRYLLVANNDIVVTDDTITRLVAYADEHPEVAVVTPRFVDGDGVVQTFVRRLPNAVRVLAHYHPVGRVVDRLFLQNRIRDRYFYLDRDFNDIEEIEQAGASFSLFRREVIASLDRLFDERFPLFFNDVDLYRRLRDTGATSHVVPSIRVVHVAGVSTARLDAKTVTDLRFRGIFAYFEKHHPMQLLVLYLAWPRRALARR